MPDTTTSGEVAAAAITDADIFRGVQVGANVKFSFAQIKVWIRSWLSGTDVPLRGYIAGLTLSATGASTSFGIAPGVATDSGNAVMMALGSAFTKTWAAWAVGSGNGALDTGSGVTASWYHVFLIRRPDTGVVDVLISLSATAPTLPANYTQFRRIGALRMPGIAGNWVKFIQDGDLFMWDAPVKDVEATNPGTSAVTRTLSVPGGVRVKALCSVAGLGPLTADNPAAILLSDLAVADAATGVSAPLSFCSYNGSTTNNQVGGGAQVMTNTSSQVRSRTALSGSGTVLYIHTFGWEDRRGRDA